MLEPETAGVWHSRCIKEERPRWPEGVGGSKTTSQGELNVGAEKVFDQPARSRDQGHCGQPGKRFCDRQRHAEGCPESRAQGGPEGHGKGSSQDRSQDGGEGRRQDDGKSKVLSWPHASSSRAAPAGRGLFLCLGSPQTVGDHVAHIFPGEACQTAAPDEDLGRTCLAFSRRSRIRKTNRGQIVVGQIDALQIACFNETGVRLSAGGSYGVELSGDGAGS